MLLRSTARARQTAPVPREVAAGIHIRPGLDEEATRENGNAIANVGFIVGRAAVAVLDAGGSLEDGERLRRHIREVTPLPVRFVLLSHVHPDHLFGAGAFVRDRPQFIGHARLPAALAQRADYYRTRLAALLGAGAAGPPVLPTRVVAGRDEIDLGGRVLELRAHETAHSDCDLSVHDRQTGTLLPADLLFVRRIPSLDGNVKGWQRALEELKGVPAVRAVPGHGPVSVDWPAGAADLERYLGVVLTETRAAFARGVELGEAVATVGRSERNRWLLFDEYHGHNVTQAFKEVEWE